MNNSVENQSTKPSVEPQEASATLPALFVQIPCELFYGIKAQKLKPLDIVVYGLIKAHAINTDKCWPGQERLADIVGLSRKTIQRSLERLKAAKHLEWKSRRTKGTNVYTILSLTSKVKPFYLPRLTEAQLLEAHAEAALFPD